jgi:tetratricopeptide (TPR) repeat protein
MSGLEGVAVASGIVQLIDFSAKVIFRVKEYKDARGSAPKIFLDISNRLPLFLVEFKSIEEWLNTNDAYGGLTSEHIEALNKLISCRDVVEKIHKLQDLALVKPKDSKWRRVGKALWSINKEKDIATEWRRLESHHIALATYYRSYLTSPDPVSPSSSKSAPIIYEVRAQRTSCFVSRPAIIRRLDEEFSKPAPSFVTKVVVLLGLGGQGKTQMALEYCRIQRSDGDQNLYGIFWVDSSSQESQRRGYRDIAKRIRSQEEFKDDTGAVDFVVQYLADCEQPWLMVLDNLDKPDEMSNIRGFIPQSSLGRVLITSRHHATKQLGSSITLDAMEESEALELLLRSTSVANEGPALLSARAVVERLGYLPLAIDHARAYVTLRQLSFDHFLQEYETRKTRVLKETPALSAYQRPQSSGERRVTLVVFTTWEMSLEQLLALSDHPDDIRDILQLFASFHPRGISERLLSAYTLDRNRDMETPAIYFVKDGAWDHEQFETLVIWMRTLSLLQFSRSANNEISLTFHRLVTEWLFLKGGRLSTDHVTDLSLFHISSYTQSFSDLGLLELAQRQQLLAQVEHILPQLLLRPPRKDLLSAGYIFGRLYRSCGILTSSERPLLWTKLGFTDLQDENNETYLKCLNVLGLLYVDLGRFEESELVLGQARRKCETAVGMDHTLTLDAVSALGTLYWSTARPVEAEQMFNQALAGYENILGKGHTSTLKAMNKLGLLYRDMFRLAEAEQMFNRALLGYQKSRGSEHISTLSTLNNFGLLYRDFFRLKKAEEMFNRALPGMEKVLGKEHNSTLAVMSNLGRVCRDLGRLGEAEQILKRALEGREKTLGNQHASTLVTVNALGLLYIKMDRLEEADQMLNRALNGRKKALAIGHTETFITMSYLGILYCNWGRLREAEHMHNQSLAGFEAAVGSEHPLTHLALHNFGEFCHRQQRMYEAGHMFKRALKGREKALGIDHPETLVTVNCLGRLFWDLGQLEDAECMYSRALTGFEKLVGEEHPFTLLALHSFGEFCYGQGRLEEAKQMLRRALTGRRKVFGEQHRLTLDTARVFEDLDSPKLGGADGV